MRKQLKQCVLAIAICMLLSYSCTAQFSIAAAATNYTENFDALASTGSGITWTNGTTASGWYARTTATASITTYGTSTGTLTTPASLYSYGVAGTNAITDRAVGYITTNAFTGASGVGLNIMAWRLKNNTGGAISSITVTYTGEQWRKDNTVAQTMNVSYQTSASPITDPAAGTWTTVGALQFSSPLFTAGASALDGNAPANRVAGISTTITVALAAGDEIMIRWTDVNDTGNDHQMTIDDVTINAASAASPSLSADALATFGAQCVGNTYGPNTFTLTGSNLTSADINVAALAGFTYDTIMAGPYYNSLTISHGASYSKLVYVKFTPVAAVSYNGNIVLSGGGASSYNVAATATGLTNAAPSISANSHTNITNTTASVGANMTAVNCSNATVRGIEWSTTQGFANGSGTQVTESGSYGAGVFSISVTGLPSGTKIYYHTFATNGNGTTYTAESSFITYLNVGDISICAMNVNTPDNFAFVTWVDLIDGTQIKFTDNGFLAAASANAANNARGGENFVRWTNNTGNPILAGTVVKIEGTTTTLGAVAQQLNGLTTTGEQIFAYQGLGAGTSATDSDFGANGNPTTCTGWMLYGINVQGSTGQATWTGLNNTSTSFLPTELNVANGNITFGANAQAAQYTGTRNGQATFAGYKALVNNTANWATVTTGTLAVNTTAFVLSAGGPTQIVVTSVNGGSSPTANAPFTISIETQDGTNTGASVSQNTDVLISIFDGTGSLIGSTTGTVLMGASTLTLTGVIYNTAETDVILTISRTAGDVLTSSNTPAFDVLQPASQIAFNNLSTFSYTNTIVQFFNVEARRPDNSVDNTYNGSATISLISGTGAITGTLTKPIVNGVALFNDIAFTTAGIKQIDAAAGVFTTITSPSITVSTPALAENHLPQYMQGTTVASNSTRVPYAARLTLSGLQASTTYRYTNQMVEAADGAAVNGAGNPIYANGAGFVRTTSASLSTLGGYGEFTTDAAGQFSGWFITEPTGNARFTPGNNVYMRVAINNGAGGTFVALRLTTTNTISVINFGATATDGTGLRGSSSAVAKNFVLLYDNTAGTGRPIAGSFVESDGSANTAGNSYVAFYGTSVEAQAGAYGTIIPNNLPNGIRRIEQRSLAQALIVSCAATDADGVWPSGANTVNPNTGTTAKVVTSLDAEFNPACVTLVPGNNDHFLSAALAPMSGLAYPAGNCYSGTLVGATVSSQGTAANVLVAGGQDRWYAFVAPSPACRVVTTTASMNIVLELHASDGSLIDTENDVAGIGGEIMATNGLTEGYTYFVAVRSYDGVLGAYSVCVQALMDSHCNDGSGTYDRCANFKPNWTGANSYTFNFTPTAPTPGIPTSATAVGQISLSNATLALIHGGTYDATIDVTYNLTDGAGNPETLVVAGNQVCSIIIANHASVEVKAEQRCGYPATLLKGSVMQGKPYVCGVTNYTVRFTKVTDCTGATTDGLPFTVNTTGASASLNLSFTLPQPLVAMSHYLVEWQPNFGYGAGLYGTPRVIFVGGSVMETELTGNDMQTKSASVQAAIYPNPNSGEMMNLNYTGEYIGILQVRISDAMGRKVCTRQYAVDGNLSTALVFENQLAPGVYLVEFVAGAEVTTERLLIQR